MPEMKMHRNFRLASTTGHVIQFKKGEKVHVPTPAVKDALSVGATFIDEAELEAMLPEEDAPKAVPQGDERETAIRGAISVLIERNEREEFSAAGMPKAEAIAVITGFKPDKKELVKIWASYQEDAALAKDAA